MTDLRLELGQDGADLVLEGDDLALDQGLFTPALVSILSDARAPAEAVGQGLNADVRGYWADSIRDRFGSRLWLLEREKRTPETLERARELARDALQWMVDDGIAERFEIVAAYDVHGRLTLEVGIFRGAATLFEHLWNGTTAVRATIAQPVAPATPVTPPDDLNIVLIYFDDGGAEWFDWSEMLQPASGYFKVPRLQGFRDLGVTFRRAYAGPICGPTRGMIETGRRSSSNGFGGNLDGPGSFGFGLGVYAGQQTELTLARALRLGRDGTDDQTLGSLAFTYAIAWFSKAHVFSDGGMNDWPTSNGYGRYTGCVPNDQSLENWPPDAFEPYEPGDPEYITPPENSGHFHWRELRTAFGGAPVVETYGTPGAWPAGGPYVAWDSTTTPRAAWSAYKATRDAIQWANARTQPFLVKLCLNPPHSPFEVPPYEAPDTVGVGATGSTVRLVDEDTEDLMNSLGGGTAGPGYRPTDPERIRQVYRANAEAVDSCIGLFWDRLDPEKRARTVFVFFGDNGTVTNCVSAPYQPGKAKRTLYEGGVRVPTIVWSEHPSIAAKGRACDHLIHATDLFPTILELANCDPELWNPGGEIEIHGKSFAPVLRDPEASPARTFVYNEITAPLGAQWPGDPTGDPPIPTIPANTWAKSYTDGTHKLIAFPSGANPPFRLFRITPEPQPGSGLPGYLEDFADDLYPLASDGFHPDLEAIFLELFDAMNDFLGV